MAAHVGWREGEARGVSVGEERRGPDGDTLSLCGEREETCGIGCETGSLSLSVRGREQRRLVWRSGKGARAVFPLGAVRQWWWCFSHSGVRREQRLTGWGVQGGYRIEPTARAPNK